MPAPVCRRRRRRSPASGRAAPRAGAVAASDGGRLRLGCAGDLHAQVLVRPGVALGEEPDLAAEPMLPPLPLNAGDVAPEIDVVRQLAEARCAARARGHFTGVGELADVARAAVGTRSEEHTSELQSQSNLV